ncbi:MAG: hypothetical protein Q9169_002481 [Polycauliona sp. 2 TL-2023]
MASGTMAARSLRMVSSTKPDPLPATPSKITGLSTFLPRTRNFKSFQSFYNAHSRQCRNLNPLASLKAFQPIRGFTSTAVYRQLQRTHVPTDEGRKDYRSDADTNNRQESVTKGEDKAVIPPTSAQSIIAAISSIHQETSWIRETLDDPNIQLTTKALTQKKAKLSELEKARTILRTKADWWYTIYNQEPKEIESYSDVYARVKIVKDALKRDAESAESVWTAQERKAIAEDQEMREAETVKRDKWYKKIAWGPSIIGTLILNAIL